ncbi:MAG TPA: aldehyde dehydrogenase family protein [Nitrospirota bacterium]|jgi:aldehyde dehydrogenase (NAD+)
MERLLNFIDGKWVEADGGRTFLSLNPADTREIIASAPHSSPDDVDRAVEAARQAFDSWRLVPAPKRGEIIFRAAEALTKEKSRLGELVTREMGKVLPEGLGDVQEAIDMAYYMAGEGRRLSGETVPSELPDKDCKSVRVPVGVFALITPWNFPVAIPAWKIFPALIAGNTVVFKPSQHTPACATELVKILVEAGLPKGVLNLVHGPGSDVGDSLATHPGVNGVSFTGSSSVGGKLAARCAIPGRVVTCEMGGKNAVIVMDDADLELAVKGIIWGGFGTAGQRCTAAARIIVHKGIYKDFINILIDAARSLKLGNGLEPGVDIGPLISDEQMKKVQHFVHLGRTEGATPALGGQRCVHGELGYGYFMEPTIFTDVRANMSIAREEIFGPFLSVMKAESLEDAIRVANGVDYGLVASIYTSNVNSSAVAERDIDTGIVYVNASTTGAEIQLPFGGEKRSGFGAKEAGGRGGALDTFTRWKVIYRDFSGKVQKAQIAD